MSISPKPKNFQLSGKTFTSLKELKNYGLKSIFTSKFGQLDKLNSALGMHSKTLKAEASRHTQQIIAPLSIGRQARVKRESAVFLEFAGLMNSLGDTQLTDILEADTKKSKKVFKGKKWKKKLKLAKKNKNIKPLSRMGLTPNASFHKSPPNELITWEDVETKMLNSGVRKDTIKKIKKLKNNKLQELRIKNDKHRSSVPNWIESFSSKASNSNFSILKNNIVSPKNIFNQNLNNFEKKNSDTGRLIPSRDNTTSVDILAKNRNLSYIKMRKRGHKKNATSERISRAMEENLQRSTRKKNLKHIFKAYNLLADKIELGEAETHPMSTFKKSARTKSNFPSGIQNLKNDNFGIGKEEEKVPAIVQKYFFFKKDIWN